MFDQLIERISKEVTQPTTQKTKNRSEQGIPKKVRSNHAPNC
jgi:hypothetical protein